MNTWIYKSYLAGFALLFALTGCNQASTAPDQLVTSGKSKTQPVTSVTIGDNRVRVPAPSGYCVDTETLDDSGRDGFVILARCNAMNGQPQSIFDGLRAPTLVVVTTRPWSGKNPDVSVADLVAAYPAEAVLEQKPGPPLALIRVSESSPDLDGVDDVHWRGALVVNDQLVALALFAPPGSAMLGPGGGEFLKHLARRISRESEKLAAASSP